MNPRTDLAVEKLEEVNESIDGTENKSYYAAPVTFTKTRIMTDEASARIGTPIGEYLTAEIPDLTDSSDNFEELSEILAKEISLFLPKPLRTVLVIGLGNREITPDALGPKATENILATRHISPELARSLGVNLKCRVAVLSPGVLGQTGVEAAEVVLGISKRIKPDAIIVIDALASKSVSRLFNTLQVSNTGITPGAGVGNSRFEISAKTLGRPVISIGMPTVVNANTFENEDKNNFDMIVTPSDVDNLISDAAKLIGLSVNRVLQPFLTFEELQYLT